MAEPRPESRLATRATSAALLASAAVMGVAAFLPWSADQEFGWTYRGISTGHGAVMFRLMDMAPFGDGWLIVGAAVLVAVSAIAGARDRRLLIGAVIASILGIGVTMFEWSELVSESTVTYYTTGGAVRAGLPLALAAAVFALVTSCVGLSKIAGLRARRMKRTAQPSSEPAQPA